MPRRAPTDDEKGIRAEAASALKWLRQHAAHLQDHEAVGARLEAEVAAEAILERVPAGDRDQLATRLATLRERLAVVRVHVKDVEPAPPRPAPAPRSEVEPCECRVWWPVRPRVLRVNKDWNPLGPFPPAA